MACDCASFRHEEAWGEEQFFDARDEDLPCGGAGSCPGTPAGRGSPEPRYRLWIENLDSIRERRRRFRRDMAMSSVSSSKAGSFDLDEFVPDCSEAPGEGGGPCREEVAERSEDSVGRTVDLRGGDLSGAATTPAGSPRYEVSSTSRGSSSPSSARGSAGRSPGRPPIWGARDRGARRRKVGWLRRLGIVACVTPRTEEDGMAVGGGSEDSVGRKASRVKVHHSGKQSKEFSAVFMGQDVRAHDGAICSMKFSPDGQYLATGGEDGVVRVWQVLESDFVGVRDLPEQDPSCICFTANHDFDLEPLHDDKEKRLKPGVMGRVSNAACVIIPPKVFQISENPLHEFRGHRGEVLDLSWSRNKFLISSSEDKTVCLWQVGCSDCIKSFPHNDYVTCVQFNPMDDNFFVSGSLDCKIRIWDVSDCHVISWSDIKEMVTAVCYQPDAKGIVAGSMGGICSFFKLSGENHLQLHERVSLQTKKKYNSRRITGFQFCPSDPQKLMVTSADSQIKILDGFEIVGKYKGLRNTSSQISASFTTDGRHIISASEDSYVHIWNQKTQDLSPKANRIRSIRSCEYFFSRDVSVAVPWYPPGSKERLSMASDAFSSQCDASRELKRDLEAQCHSNSSSMSSCRFSLDHRFFLELLPRGSATWPEEKLPSISSAASSTLSKSGYKFLHACCEKAIASHSWGQVIVTAGLDGRIRSYSNYGLPVGG